MSQPKQPTEPEPADPSRVENPTGQTPQGVPQGAHEHDSKASPSSDREQTETAVHKAGEP